MRPRKQGGATNKMQQNHRKLKTKHIPNFTSPQRSSHETGQADTEGSGRGL